ncbi:MAG TPA: mevalonate kinase [Anaerolineae bacterium]|nr:mevalonate kinase [Anaerolineae bacterium]
MTIASACGKIILLGEHAVVYGRPALAAPLPDLRATAAASDLAEGEPGSVCIEAPDIELAAWLHELSPDQPLAVIVRLTRQALAIEKHPPLALRVQSSIPVASGLGSGTAVSVAVLRALSAHWGHPLAPERQSALAFEVEKLHHGTPSGIDNTVVAYEQPVYFVRGDATQPFPIGAPFTLVLGDTGLRSNTSMAVGMVLQAWQAEKERFEALFDRVAGTVALGRKAIEQGDWATLGEAMDKNQQLLQEIGVSSDELETLIETAKQAGALGAKLSGAGMGGNMIALVETEAAADIEQALQNAGAAWTMTVEVGA